MNFRLPTNPLAVFGIVMAIQMPSYLIAHSATGALPLFLHMLIFSILFTGVLFGRKWCAAILVFCIVSGIRGFNFHHIDAWVVVRWLGGIIAAVWFVRVMPTRAWLDYVESRSGKPLCGAYVQPPTPNILLPG